MSLYDVQRLFYNIVTDRTLHDRFQAQRAAVIQDYDMTSAEQAAILDLDVFKLSRMGVHPILLLGYARSQRMLTDDFVNLLNDDKAGD